MVVVDAVGFWLAEAAVVAVVVEGAAWLFDNDDDVVGKQSGGILLLLLVLDEELTMVVWDDGGGGCDTAIGGNGGGGGGGFAAVSSNGTLVGWCAGTSLDRPGIIIGGGLSLDGWFGSIGAAWGAEEEEGTPAPPLPPGGGGGRGGSSSSWGFRWRSMSNRAASKRDSSVLLGAASLDGIIVLVLVVANNQTISVFWLFSTAGWLWIVEELDWSEHASDALRRVYFNCFLFA